MKPALRALGLAAMLASGQQPDFQTSYREGLLALGRGDLHIARTKLEAARTLEPGNPRVRLALADAYLKLGDRALSEAAASEAEKLGPRDPAVMRGLSMYHSGRGAYAKAAGCESRYAALAPEDGQAVVRAMRLWLEAQQPKRAIALALAAPGWETRPDLRNLLGLAYDADRQYLKAIPELQHAIRLSPRQESFHLDLAMVLLAHHNFEAAIQLLEASKRAFPRSAQIELAFGVALYGQGRHPEAIESFLRVISLDPGIEQPYIFLGRILERADDRLADAIRQFEALERREPKNHLGYFLHAKALMVRLEDVPKAEQLLRRATSLNAAFWESHYELGRALEHRGALEEAAKAFQRSAQLNNRAPQPHFRLAAVLLRLGRQREANAERALYQKLAQQEREAVQKRLAGITRLNLVIE